MGRAILLALSGVLAGPLTCIEADEDDPPAVRTAKRVWAEDCAACHGLAGDGTGAAGKGLSPPVPSFTDPCRPASREWIERVIVEGGESFRGNPAMQPHHELKETPEVLAAMVDVIHAMRGEGECATRPEPPVDDPP